MWHAGCGRQLLAPGKNHPDSPALSPANQSHFPKGLFGQFVANRTKNRHFIASMKITSTSQPYHLPQLDGLRGIAITLVTLGHLASFSLHRWVAVANAFAQLGVLLF